MREEINNETEVTEDLGKAIVKELKGYWPELKCGSDSIKILNKRLVGVELSECLRLVERYFDTVVEPPSFSEMLKYLLEQNGKESIKPVDKKGPEYRERIKRIEACYMARGLQKVWINERFYKWM